MHEWTSPGGKLLLRTTETVYKNFPVREYLPELAAVGDAPTDIVDDFRSVSISRAAGGTTVRALRERFPQMRCAGDSRRCAARAIPASRRRELLVGRTAP